MEIIPTIGIGTRIFKPAVGNITITSVVREPQNGVGGQYLYRSDTGEEGDISQPAALTWLRRYGAPAKDKDEIDTNPGLRFYIPLEGTLEEPHAATIDHDFPSPYGDGGMVWVYICDCGFVGDVRPENVVQWLGQYGTPPPKPEPLPRLDYTEESLISDLAFVQLPVPTAVAEGLFYEAVGKARELVKRRRD